MQKKLATIISLAIAFTAQAESNFDQSVLTIVEHSPIVAAAQARAAATVAANRSVNNLNDPVVDFENVWGWKGIGNKLAIGLSQSFDWPGLYSARSQQAAAENAVAQCEVDKAAFDLRQQVRLKLLDIAYCNSQIKALASIESNLTKLQEAYETGLKKGENTILEVKKAQLEVLTIRSQTARVRDERQQYIGEILVLTDYSDAEQLCLNVDMPENLTLYSVDKYLADANLFDPDIKLAQAQADVNTAEVKVVKRQGYPSFSLGYKYNYEFGDYFNGFTASMTLPFLSNRHKRQAVSALSESIASDRYQRTTELRGEISALHNRALEIQKEINAFDEVLNETDLPRLLKRSLDAGQMSLTDYLVEINNLENARLERLNAIYRLQQTLVTLNRLS